MKLRWLIISKPLSFSILLAFVVLILPCLLIPSWYSITRHIHSHLLTNDYNATFEMSSEMEKMSTFVQPITISTINFARILSSSMNGTRVSFFDMRSKIAPLMFEGFSVIPYLTQISYIGMDGLFFSFYIDRNQTFAVYSNSTSTANSYGQYAESENFWLTQLVNTTTGQLYGNMAKTLPMFTSNTSWFQEAMNSNHGCASIGIKWNYDRDRLFLNTARINGSNGVVSLGFSIKDFADLFTSIGHQEKRLYLATMDGEVIVRGHPDIKMTLIDGSASIRFLGPKGVQIAHIGNISCLPEKERIDANAALLNIQGTSYMIYCSPLEILGVQLVSVLLLPQTGFASLVHKSSRMAVILLILILITVVISIFSFAFIVIRAAKREVYLCAKLIEQMEATQQAERKSMNKSVAFASASHDIRASLAGIIGLIEICHDDAAPGSDLDTNLKQMDHCTKDLLGILNSILDISKIEAGKVQLEEEEFHLGELLEDVVDLYHHVGMKKGIDVVLDPYDGSVIKFSQVKGDRGKLKQVLCNLLSNAVKFTPEGHVTVRAWVRKLPSLQNKMIASNQNGLIMERLSFLLCKNTRVFEDLQSMNDGVQCNPDCMEFTFEVDDTGRGIPKEKQKLVFENYVQVRETASGHEGTGLGLGIVQSLVRLMGGDIAIMDKEIGEKGTCFRFNVLLTISETMCSNDLKENTGPDDDMNQIQSISRQTFQTPSPSLRPQGLTRISSSKIETSRVVLLIANDQRRMICKKFMERLGAKVLALKQWEHLLVTLQKILDRQSHSRHNSRGKSDMSSPTDCLSNSTSCNSVNGINMDVSLAAMQDGRNYLRSTFKKTNLKGVGFSFILIVIDARAGPLKEVSNMVANFRRILHTANCKVVWLMENQMSRTINRKDRDSDFFDPNDVIISRPFHGSRLYEVIRLIPEFGGPLPTKESSGFFQVGNVPSDPSSSLYRCHSQVSSGVQDETNSSSETSKMNLPLKPVGGHRNKHQEIREEKDEKPLSGKKILVAEDNAVLLKVATLNLVRLGATIDTCENGEEALELVCNGLHNLRKHGASNTIPYDYILMDCEMPLMDGYEATREIRKMERYYSIHIPIIALTAHTTGEEVNRTIEAGMDVHLAKPLKKENLLQAITTINSK